MKKLVLSIACCLLVLGVLTGCGKSKVNDDNQSNTGNDNQTNNNAQSATTLEVFGYSYTISNSAVGRSSNYGHISATSKYSIFTYGRDDIIFETWDNITETSFKSLENSLDSAYSFYPMIQTNDKTEKKTNKYGETVLKVSGTMKGNQAGEGTKERQFIGAYYVTNDNHVRFTIGLVDEDYNALDKAIDLIIDNLHKV